MDHRAKSPGKKAAKQFSRVRATAGSTDTSWDLVSFTVAKEAGLSEKSS